MINRKPNTNIKLLLFLGIFVSISSCETKESFTFQKRTIAIQDFFDCDTVDCAITEIFLLESIQENEISNNINFEIEKTACSALYLEEAPKNYHSIEKALQSFNIEYQEMKKEFPEEIVPYEASINCEISFQNTTILSVFIDSYIYTGGAHGSGNATYLNLDLKTGKTINHNSLFKDINEFSSFAEMMFRKAHKISENASINSTGFFFENDMFVLPANIGLTNTHVILLYNQYEISSYAEGPIELKLNKEEVTKYFAINIL
ncbi:DUF3298 and DUF4163 domain-containing protein [Aquimarina sp. 2201CG14-23]|uniref:DUF3298 and DUF4163 domain-containing protein n=1 Tax=Aquimarina mycalae TaxID=3040073 RepID=UPI002477D8F8|nr:DUF3298 and DUF4163 domain-containing protein [Aquimarina sp. 2201CG14-23]MDH7447370.1 DUF4163 domain-containing protein [Aquimarina sp. 2201CG14-23]